MTDIVTSPFETPAQQRHAAAFGIWLFLATEVLFFGVLLTVYAVARSLHGDDFLAAARHSRLGIGTLNSVLLLTSSLMVSLAVKSEQLGQRRSVAPLLIVAIGLGMAFGAAKGVEYYLDVADGYWPGPGSAIATPGGQLYWSLYWLMTGVHAVHLAVGIAVSTAVVVLLVNSSEGDETRRVNLLRVTALYWHLVDIVWIVLYPLLYLAGRAA